MEITDYLSDNLYQLLGIGSGMLQAEIRQMAAAAESGLRSGEDADPTQVSQNALPVPSWVRTAGRMDQDAVLRSVYRLFWPFYLPASANFQGLKTDQEMERLASSLGNAPGFYGAQLRFLRSWRALIAAPSPAVALQALAAFRQVYEDHAITGYLTDLLRQEEVEFAQAVDAIAVAMSRAMDTLLDAVVHATVASWNVEDFSASFEYIRAVLQSGLPVPAIQRAIEPLAVCGREAEAKLLASTPSCLEWLTKETATLLPGVYLGRLAEAVKGRIPEADRWAASYDRCIRSIAVGARDATTDLAFAVNEPAKAQIVLENLLAQPLPEDLARQVRADLAQLRENIAKGPTNGGQFKLTHGAPSLGTINYIGFRIYGRTPCPERPGWHFATHYFVVFLIPLIPIRRYLVADAPGGGWYFFASAPLTRPGRWHQIISLVLLSLLIGFGVYSANQKPSASYQPQAQVAPPPYSAKVEAERAKRRELQAEASRLNRDLVGDEIVLNQRESDLNEKTAQLKKDSTHVDRSSSRAVNAYNKRLKELKNETDQYNKDIGAHNKKVDRIHAIEKQLGTQ